MFKSFLATLRTLAASCLLLTLVACGSGSNSPAPIATAISIATTSLPGGAVGIAYSAQIAVTNGTQPYSFSVSSGLLPNGLNISSNGLVYGTPTAPGSYGFTLSAADSQGQRASQAYAVTITGTGSPVSITTASLPSGTVGVAYSATIVAANGAAPYTFSISSGTLPAGLSLSSAGVLFGTPTASGASTFGVTVADANLQRASATYTVTIAAAAQSPISITTASLPSGTVGVPYSALISAANGTTPYTFSVISGMLPAGLMLSSSGILSGTPTVAATSSFTITVTDAESLQASAMFSITITAAQTPISITTTSLPSGTVGTAYNAAIVAANGTPAYTFLVTSGATPTGLTLSPVGVLAGTPTAVGTFNFTVSVSDANSQQASATYSIAIAPASLSITTTSLPAGTVNTAYSATILAANGTAPYSYAVTSGAPLAGLTLSSAGVLSGTPTASGTSSFTVTVTDVNSQQASQVLNLTINPAATGSLVFNGATLPAAIVSTTYATTLEISGGVAPYTVTLANGNLPAGLNLSSSGVISGTASATGSFNFTAKATDNSSPQQTASATFTLNVANAIVQVNTASTLAVVPQTFFGIHTSVYDGSLDDTARLPALLKTGGITTLRYPGGSYADLYHWAQNSLTPLYASSSPACGLISDGYLAANTDFGNFIRSLQATGTQPVITINYGSSVADSSATLSAGSTVVPNRCSNPNAPGQPEEAAAWVAYANGSPSSTQNIGVDAAGFDWKTVGYWASLRAATPLATDDGYNFLRIGQTAPLGFKYWEIGNEMYYNGWAGNRNYEEDIHAPYIYPNGYAGGSYDSRNELAALSPTAYGTNSIAFIEAMKAVDPTILVGVDFASPGATDPIPLNWNPDLAQAVCAGANIDLAIIHYYPGTYNGVEPGELLTLPQSDIPRVVAGIQANLAQYCPANASAIQFWLTETSPNGTLASTFPQPVLGLFALNEYLTSLETGIQNIDWLELHNGTYLDENENPGPAYYGIQLAHLLAGVGDSVVAASSSSSNVISYATAKTNGQTGVLLINANPSNPAVVQVTVSGATLGATATEYSYGIATTQNTSALAPTSFTVPGNSFAVTVPAYTAVELLVP